MRLLILCSLLVAAYMAWNHFQGGNPTPATKIAAKNLRAATEAISELPKSPLGRKISAQAEETRDDIMDSVMREMGSLKESSLQEEKDRLLSGLGTAKDTLDNHVGEMVNKTKEQLSRLKSRE